MILDVIQVFLGVVQVFLGVVLVVLPQSTYPQVRTLPQRCRKEGAPRRHAILGRGARFQKALSVRDRQALPTRGRQCQEEEEEEEGEEEEEDLFLNAFKGI